MASEPNDEPHATSGGGPKDESEAAPDTARPATEPNVERHVEWLERLAADPDRRIGLDAETAIRLRRAATRIALPDRQERRRLVRARRRARDRRERERDEAALEATSHRARKRALAFPVAPATVELTPEHRRLLERQARARRRDSAAESLDAPRPCYVCKQSYHELHHHYDSLCPECAAVNWSKRHQTADLTGRVALVTGARVKIGFEIALMLLRAGARVIGTSRFVCDAASRFEKEDDFDFWSDRLVLHALDLRDTPEVEAFCATLIAQESRLDYLIHNACQTVRRPPAYYEERVASEEPARLSSRSRALLAHAESGSRVPVAPGRARAPGAIAALSRIDSLEEAAQAHLFPSGLQDGDGQPVDLREQNSWRLELADVSAIELIEVHLVNAIAPFVLNGRLRRLMGRVSTGDQHIVNVSAMEGQFGRTFKTTRHPHTNMAKAALNMMTRTSAADYVRDGIHMNSVDTGWVTDEDPLAKAVEKDEEHRFSPPLDSIDGAARVLDPIFSGIETGVHCWGQFLKDYRPTRW